MTSEHKYAQVLRWIADGKEVQFQESQGVWVKQDWQITLEEIIALEYGVARYRAAPKMLNIGGVVVEAPVLNPAAGQELWYIDDRGVITNFEHYALARPKTVANGRAFASEEAAHAANRAITALLTGGQA